MGGLGSDNLPAVPIKLLPGQLSRGTERDFRRDCLEHSAAGHTIVRCVLDVEAKDVLVLIKDERSH